MYEFIVCSRSLASIVVAALLIVACATPDSKSSASAPGTGTVQPAMSPAATKAAAESAVAASADAEAAAAPKPSATAKPDTYLVQPGDTLALIARRAEIYGDSSMWMMLYRANAGQIPNMDWLCPGQVLAVPRGYTEVDARTARQEALHRAPWPPGAKARASYLCDGLPRRPSVRAGAAPTGAAATPTKSSAVAAGAPASSASAADSGAARAADVRNAPLAVPNTASPITVGTSPNAYRDAARRAYNMRDIPWAMHYYRQHLAKVPRDTDALGELGNLYYQAGNLPAAAALFYDAARLLLEKGRRDAASRLLLAVSEGNPALADDLYARLSVPAKR